MSDIKKRLNITGRCYVKQNKAEGAILSFLTNVPIQADAANLLFIFTIPGEDQKYAPAYCRLQDKSKMKEEEDISFDKLSALTEIRSVGHLKETKKGNIIVCVPTEHVLVELDKLVVIATIPTDGKKAAPCYIRRKTYDRSKEELEATIRTPAGDIEEQKEDIRIPTFIDSSVVESVINRQDSL